MPALSSKLMNVELQHVYRECNKATDFMARLSSDLEGNRIMHWQNPPRGLEALLNEYKVGVKWPRRICCKA